MATCWQKYKPVRRRMTSCLSTYEEWTSPVRWQRPAFSRWWFHERTGSYERRRSDPRPTRPPRLRSASPRLRHAEFQTLLEGGGCRLSSRCISVRGLQADQFPNIYNDIHTWYIRTQEHLLDKNRKKVYGVFMIKGDGGTRWEQRGEGTRWKREKERRLTGNKRENKEGREQSDR